MRHGVALGVEPAPAASGVDPALAEPALRVRADEDVLGPGRVVERLRIWRARDVRFAAAAELGLVARAAPGTANEQHQCATAAAPCSSISAPVVKRSSAKGFASGCASPLASVQAKTWPEPGVALKPPVPQPPLMYRSWTGRAPIIGEASGHTSTMPPQLRIMRRRLKIGKSSRHAAIWCSITWNEPRCAQEL